MINVTKSNHQIEYIDVTKIIHPETSMRTETDKEDIAGLVRSIKHVGLIHPIVLKKKGEYYEVVAGYRRHLAIEKLAWKTIPSFVIEDDKDLAIGIMTAENYEREEVNVFDEAIFLHKVMESSDLSQKQVAAVINRTESYVSERLAVLRYIEPLRDALYQNKISFSVARELNKIKDDYTQVQYVRYAVENGCTPEVARKWRKQIEASETATLDEVVRKAADGYNEHSQTAIVKIECIVCRKEIDVNEMRTIYVCKECQHIIRHTSLE
jgi:ParB family chromosome partitioning protein